MTAEERNVPATDAAGDAGATDIGATVISPTAMPAGWGSGDHAPGNVLRRFPRMSQQE